MCHRAYVWKKDFLILVKQLNEINQIQWQSMNSKYFLNQINKSSFKTQALWHTSRLGWCFQSIKDKLRLKHNGHLFFVFWNNSWTPAFIFPISVLCRTTNLVNAVLASNQDSELATDYLCYDDESTIQLVPKMTN